MWSSPENGARARPLLMTAFVSPEVIANRKPAYVANETRIDTQDASFRR